MPALHIQTNAIYEMALPTQDDRIDLCHLSRGGDRFANEWCNQLRDTGTANSDIETPFRTAKRLRHLYTEAKNLEQLKAIRSLGLGFPFVQLTHDGKRIATPLLIWPLQLDAAASKVDTWHLRYDAGQSVRFNPVLTRLFQEKFDLSLSDELLAADGSIYWGELETLFTKLNFDVPEEDTIVPCPTDEDSLAELLWSGVIALYPPTNISSPDRLFPDFNNQKEESIEEHSFGLQTLGKHQAAAFNTVLHNTFTNITGTQGTGKSYLLTHLLSNALSNAKCCLVLSDSVPTLKKTQQKLEQLDVQNLSFLLKDEHSDPQLLLEVLRSSGVKKEVPEFAQEGFQLLLNRCMRNQRKLEQYHDMANTHVFGGKTWTETVGDFLRANRMEGKERLNSHLNPQEFEFTYEEYSQLLDAIRACADNYSRVASLNHPLKNLNASIFTGDKAATGIGFVEQTVDLFLDKAYRLQDRFIQKISTYRGQLREYYEQFYQQFSSESIALQELLIDAQGQFGEELDQVSSRSLSASFSRRKKQISKVKSQLEERYNALEQQFSERQYFNFEFLSNVDTIASLDVIDNLGDFESQLNRWVKKLDEQVYDETKRLSSRTVQAGVDFQEQIEELEYALDVFIGELNSSGLYSAIAENKMLTVPKRQLYLESLIEKLETTRFHIRDYELFFNWQYAWLQRSEIEHKIIHALIKVRSKYWEEAFKSWYLYHCLAKAHDPSVFIQNDVIIEELYTDLEILKPMLARQVQAYWHFYHEDERKDLRRDYKKAFQFLFSKKQKNTATFEDLQSNIGIGFTAVSSFTPVIFATPKAAKIFLQIPEASFDYLIIEDAHGSLPQRYAPYFGLAQKIVTFTDSNVQAQGISVAQLLEKRGAAAVELQKLHTPTVSYLQRFKAAIQGNELPRLANYHDSPENLQIVHAAGRFNEKDGTNEVEAQEVIRQLNRIEPTPQRTYPSVGIVCFSTGQRDLIVTYLSDLRRKKGVAKTLIQSLDRNGLGVFRADELHGQRFDIVILSCTFGMMDLAGTLTEQVKNLTSPSGEQLMRLVLGSAEKQCFIINSIPDTELVTFANDKEHKGLYILANLIEFSNAVNREDKKLQQELLTFFRDSEAEHIDNSSLFIAEVAEALRPYFEVDRVQESIAVDRSAQELPLIVQATWDDKWKSCIYPEGLLENSTIMDYSAAYLRQARLEEDGYIYQPVWSVDWWKNPNRAARKLASKIIKTASL